MSSTNTYQSDPPYICATRFAVLLPWYDTLVSHLTCEKDTKQHLIERADINSQTRMLDVGCGSGTLLQYAEQRMDSSGIYPRSMVGLDIDARILEQARRKLSGSKTAKISVCQLVQANAQELPFSEHSFTTVTCSLVFHHLMPMEKQQALREMHRVLTPGGKLLLADFARPASLIARLRFLTVQLVDGWQRTQSHIQGILPILMQQTGFVEIQETLSLTTPLGTIRCYQALAHR